MASPAIGVQTHRLQRAWLDLLKRKGGPRYSVAPLGALPDVIHMNGAPFMTRLPGMFDYDLRIRNMDRAGVDVACRTSTGSPATSQLSMASMREAPPRAGRAESRTARPRAS
jgi:hypothetical protein